MGVRFGTERMPSGKEKTSLRDVPGIVPALLRHHQTWRQLAWPRCRCSQLWLLPVLGAPASGCSQPPSSSAGAPLGTARVIGPKLGQETLLRQSPRSGYSLYSARWPCGDGSSKHARTPGTQQFARYGCNLCIFILFPRKGVVMQTMS